jgi:hypothetical protein
LRTSLIVSLVMHGMVLVIALIGFGAHDSADSPTPVPVDIVAPTEISALKSGKPEPEPEKAAGKAAPLERPQKIVRTTAKLNPTMSNAKKEVALPPPKPKSLPPEPTEAPIKQDAKAPDAPAQPRTASVPPPVKRAERPKPRRKTTPRDSRQASKPRPRSRNDRIAELIERPAPQAQGKSDFDPQRIAALLNRDPTAGERASLDGPREPWRRPSTFEEQVSGLAEEPRERFAHAAPEGRDSRMSANEIDAFRAQISRCWTPPVGGLGGDAIIVKLRIMLNEDGTLGRAPEIANSYNSPFFRPAADAAVRAVVQCQPYRMPPEKYAEWRDMLLSFDPSRMYGG